MADYSQPAALPPDLYVVPNYLTMQKECCITFTHTYFVETGFCQFNKFKSWVISRASLTRLEWTKGGTIGEILKSNQGTLG